MIQVIPFFANDEPLYLPVLARGLSDLASLRLNSIGIESQVNVYMEHKNLQTYPEQPVADVAWGGEELWLVGTLKGAGKLELSLRLFNPELQQVIFQSSIKAPEAGFLVAWEQLFKKVMVFLAGAEDFESKHNMYTESLEAFLAFRRGLESLAQAKNDRAQTEGLENLLKAVAYDPDFVEAADILILFLVQNEVSKNYERSVDILERLRQIANYHPRIPLVLAEVYLQWGKPEKAAAILEELTEAFPEYSDGWIRRALLYHSQQQLDEALSALQNVLTVDPNNLTAHDLMGAVLAGKGEIEEAERVWKQALALDPSRVNILTNLALLAEEKEAFDQAEVFYKEGLSTGSDWWGVYHYYGTFCLRRKRFEEAVALLDEAVRLNSTHYLSIQNLAFAQLQLEQYQEAQDSLLQLLRLASDNQARRQTLQLLNELNDPIIKTEVNLRKLYQEWETGKRLAIAANVLKSYVKARKLWYYWYLAGKIIADSGCAQMGVLVSKRGLRYEPGFPLYQNLGLYYWRKKQYRKALPFLRQAYQLHQSEQEITDAYLQTLLHLGEVEELHTNIKGFSSLNNHEIRIGHP